MTCLRIEKQCPVNDVGASTNWMRSPSGNVADSSGFSSLMTCLEKAAVRSARVFRSCAPSPSAYWRCMKREPDRSIQSSPGR